jgi:hypothetical protein
MPEGCHVDDDNNLLCKLEPRYDVELIPPLVTGEVIDRLTDMCSTDEMMEVLRVLSGSKQRYICEVCVQCGKMFMPPESGVARAT